MVKQLSIFVRLLCPIAPHLCEELWEGLGEKGFCSMANWPEYDEAKTVDSEIEIAVQANGKLRATITIPAGCDKDTALSIAKASDKVQAALAGFAIVKEIYVPGKIINFVVKPQ